MKSQSMLTLVEWILVKSTVSGGAGQMTYGREKSGRLARNLFRTPFPPPPSISLPGISISSHLTLSISFYDSSILLELAT